MDIHVKPDDKSECEVVVGNVGVVYAGPDRGEAYKTYVEYIRLSKEGYGRVAYEDVTLFRDGEPIREYYPRPSLEDGRE